MKKYGWIVLIIVIVIIGTITIVINNIDKELSSSIVIDTKSDIDDTDFSELDSNEITLSNENIKITKEGEYHITGSLDNGMILINSTGNIKLILDNVTINNDSGPTIYIENAKNTYIELVGENNLRSGSTYSSTYLEYDGCIFSSDDLIFEGIGTLNITSNYQDGIVSKDYVKFLNGNYNITSNDDGIRGKDYVYIENGTFNIKSGADGIKSTNDTDSSLGYIEIVKGTFTIDATGDGLQAETNVLIHDGEFDITTGNGSSNGSTNNGWGSWGNTNTTSAKGIKAINNLVIEDGTINIDSSDDSIHSNNSISIDGGVINAISGDDGIHADSDVIINSGIINIKGSYEGIEGSNITINSGMISIVASDDGINVAGGNDQSAQGGRPGANHYSSNSNNKLIINGGEITVNAIGDGLDANGSILLTGGIVYIDGPSNSGNGSLDYDSSFEITGGVILATSFSGMAQTPSTSSSQYSMMVYLNNNYSSKVTIKDGNTTLIEFTPTKSYGTVLYSSDKLKNNSSYDIYLNDQLYTTIKITSKVTSNGSNYMNGGRR